MRALRKTSLKITTAGALLAASMMMAGTTVQAAPGDYCNYVDGTVYCGVEENIVEGDPGLRACIRRWELASLNC
ncbi:MAG: hypothetical protein EBR82_02910 [Caulobacteraceae bacterium]|nr:hypothetical protein [Caulobacteraceae bacterium]